jgi:hypothetical protein
MGRTGFNLCTAPPDVVAVPAEVTLAVTPPPPLLVDPLIALVLLPPPLLLLLLLPLPLRLPPFSLSPVVIITRAPPSFIIIAGAAPLEGLHHPHARRIKHRHVCLIPSLLLLLLMMIRRKLCRRRRHRRRGEAEDGHGRGLVHQPGAAAVL